MLKIMIFFGLFTPLWPLAPGVLQWEGSVQADPGPASSTRLLHLQTLPRPNPRTLSDCPRGTCCMGGHSGKVWKWKGLEFTSFNLWKQEVFLTKSVKHIYYKHGCSKITDKVKFRWVFSNFFDKFLWKFWHNELDYYELVDIGNQFWVPQKWKLMKFTSFRTNYLYLLKLSSTYWHNCLNELIYAYIFHCKLQSLAN